VGVKTWFHALRAAQTGFGPTSKGGPTENLCTKSERITLSCRVTCAWSETFDLYNQQIVILPINTKTTKKYSRTPDRLTNPPPPTPVGSAHTDRKTETEGV
jgi:hypothetical protein